MNGQVTLDVDGRSEAQKRTDGYRLALSERAKVTGQARAVQHDPDGYDRASSAIRALDSLGGPFDASDVRAWAGPFESPNVIGAAFSAARKAGVIRSAGITTSKATSRHGGLVRLWEGVP